MAAEIIEGLSHAQYDKIGAEHSGVLRKMLISPLAYLRAKQLEAAGIDEDRDVLRLGRAVHTAVLEPSLFARQYICWSGGKRAGAAWNAYVADAERLGQTILKEDQIDLAVKIAKAVRGHPIARPILDRDGRAEVAIVWDHPRTGVRIKVRLDWLTVGVLTDLKSCRDPAPHRFATTAAQLGYHCQLALYADACAAAGLGAVEVKIIAVQNTEPFDVVVYALDEDILSIGRNEYERALDLLVQCRESKQWLGQAMTGEVPLKLPAWARPEEDSITIDGEVM